MNGIAAHFRYISKNGRLDVEDELGTSGNSTDRQLADAIRRSMHLVWRQAPTIIAPRSEERGMKR